MKYLKLFENFEYDTLEKPDVSDTTIDDVFGDDFFDDMKDDGSYIDKLGIIHIKNWSTY